MTACSQHPHPSSGSSLLTKHQGLPIPLNVWKCSSDRAKYAQMKIRTIIRRLYFNTGWEPPLAKSTLKTFILYNLETMSYSQYCLLNIQINILTQITAQNTTLSLNHKYLKITYNVCQLLPVLHVINTTSVSYKFKSTIHKVGANITQMEIKEVYSWPASSVTEPMGCLLSSDLL